MISRVRSWVPRPGVLTDRVSWTTIATLCLTPAYYRISHSLSVTQKSGAVGRFQLPDTTPRPLIHHLDTLPEGNVIGNIPGCLLWLRIVPGGILVDLPVYLNVIIAANALPGTSSMGFTLLEIFAVNGVRRKIMVTLHKLAAIAL